MERNALTLRARLTAHLPQKIAVWLGLAVGICVPYFTLQRVTLFPTRTVPALALDRAIAFDPAWIWPYLSLGLLVPLAPLLAGSRESLSRYARGLALLCLACFACFLLFPVEGPRPSAADHAIFRLIVAVDRPTNSMPSLHAGLVVYSLLFVWWELRGGLGTGAAWGVALAGGLWGALVLYSTLATKQHWVLDLPAGALLAGCAHARVWRRAALARDEPRARVTTG